MTELRGQVAVVTGAGGGIGRAVSLGLAAEGVTVWLVGRDAERLAAVAQSAPGGHGRCVSCPADITEALAIEALRDRVERDCGAVDILVHSAAVIALGRHGELSVAEMDRQYRVNVRAPYALTSALLPMLRARRGQVIFVNSSAGLAARAGVGQYAATKHALKAIADGLREEVNPYGVRVLSLFLGRTATPMQAEIHQAEGRMYSPDLLMQAEDVATMVLSALGLPRTAEVTEIAMRPMQKSC